MLTIPPDTPLTLEVLNTRIQASVDCLSAESLLVDMFSNVTNYATTASRELQSTISELTGASPIKKMSSPLQKSLEKMSFSQYSRRQIQVPLDYKGEMLAWSTIVEDSGQVYVDHLPKSLDNLNKILGALLTNEDYTQVPKKLGNPVLLKEATRFSKQATAYFPGTHKETQELRNVYASKTDILLLQKRLMREFVITPEIVDDTISLSNTIASRANLLSGKADSLKGGELATVKQIGQSIYEYARATEHLSMLTFDWLRIEGHFKNLQETIIADFR